MTDFFCRVGGIYAGPWPWSFGWKVTSNQLEANLLTTWTNAWEAAWTDAAHGLQTLYPVGTEITEFKVVTLGPTGRHMTASTNVASLVGTAAGDTLPYLNATLVSLRSGGLQKTNRGRTYLPAMEETNVNGDILIPASQGRTSAAVNAVFSAIKADGSSVFVWPTKLPKSGVSLYTKTVITEMKVSNKPARQSRRVRRITPSYI